MLCYVNIRVSTITFAKRKEEKYIEIACNHHFFPIAFETFGHINQFGADFISTLGHRISTHIDDPPEKFLLFNAFSLQTSSLKPIRQFVRQF